MSKTIEDVRFEFWTFFAQQAPPFAVRLIRDSNNYCPVAKGGLVQMSFSLTKTGSSVFLRGERDAGDDTARPILLPNAETLAQMLNTSFQDKIDEGKPRYLRKWSKAVLTSKSDWPTISQWFISSQLTYSKVLAGVLGTSA